MPRKVLDLKEGFDFVHEGAAGDAGILAARNQWPASQARCGGAGRDGAGAAPGAPAWAAPRPGVRTPAPRTTLLPVLNFPSQQPELREVMAACLVGSMCC